MRKLALGLALSALMTVAAVPASATVVTLTFEGAGDLADLGNFYNGGTDSLGYSGTNYGVSFGVDSMSVVDASAGGSGTNIGNNPSGVTAMFFLSDVGDVMDVAAGFNTGFSFFYAAGAPGNVTVYNGLDGTGTVLASLQLGATQNTYYSWSPIGVNFAGVAESVTFGGAANTIAFDNVTLGSSTPGGALPEPTTWAMMIVGLFGLGVIARRKNRPFNAMA